MNCKKVELVASKMPSITPTNNKTSAHGRRRGEKRTGNIAWEVSGNIISYKKVSKNFTHIIISYN